jgi:hypothetical protein
MENIPPTVVYLRQLITTQFMAQPYLIRISVYPYIRKFLMYHYGETFFVTDRGYIPGFVLNALERPVKVDPAAFKKKDKIIYGDFIGVQVGAATARKKGNIISGDNVKLFNEVVADLIHEQMYLHVSLLNKNGCQVDDSIRNFQEMHGFTEDELPFENLKRWYYRERQRLEMRKMIQATEEPQLTLNFFAEKPTEQATSDQLGAQMSLLGFGG